MNTKKVSVWLEVVRAVIAAIIGAIGGASATIM